MKPRENAGQGAGALSIENAGCSELALVERGCIDRQPRSGLSGTLQEICKPNACQMIWRGRVAPSSRPSKPSSLEMVFSFDIDDGLGQGRQSCVGRLLFL